MGLPNNRSKTVQLFDLGIDTNFGFHSIFDGRCLSVRLDGEGQHWRTPSPKRAWNFAQGNLTLELYMSEIMGIKGNPPLKFKANTSFISYSIFPTTSPTRHQQPWHTSALAWTF